MYAKLYVFLCWIYFLLQNIKMGKDYLGADQRKTTDKKDTEEKEIKVQFLSYLNVKQH